METTRRLEQVDKEQTDIAVDAKDAVQALAGPPSPVIQSEVERVTIQSVGTVETG